MENPRCRLILATPASPELSTFTGQVSAAFAGGDVSTLILALETEDNRLWRDIAEIVQPQAIEAQAAFLISDQVKLAEEFHADGVHIETGHDELPAIVESMRPERIVGAGAIFNRHTAMNIGELGVDYVFFGRVNLAPDDRKAAETVKELTEWWGPLFQIPCVAFAASMEDVEKLIGLGTDFIAVRDLVWNHPDGPGAATEEINRLIDKSTIAI